jgi:hypothetical protein
MALTRLALLPGPNALPAPALPAVAKPTATPQPASVVTLAAAPSASVPPNKHEPGLKTVSLDSLPVLGSEEKAASEAEPPPSVTTSPAAESSVKAAPKPTAPASRAQASKASEPTRAAVRPKPKAVKPVKAEPRQAVERKPVATSAPVVNDNPLKAAIRSAIAADQAKK